MNSWSTRRFSDVDRRDGFGVELIDADGNCVAEAFADDDTRSFTVTTFGNSVPVPALEHFLSEARQQISTFTDGSPLPPPATVERAPSGKGTTEIGFRNRNWQTVLRDRARRKRPPPKSL